MIIDYSYLKQKKTSLLHHFEQISYPPVVQSSVSTNNLSCLMKESFRDDSINHPINISMK